MASPEDAPPFPASLAGRFAFEVVLGSGSFGTVYRARDEELGRRVAIKLLRATTGDAAVRFRREAEVLMGLRHPGVVALYDHGEVPEGSYLVLELIEGRSFEEVPPLRPLVALKQVAEALDAIHQAGVVHRDVKPENLIATDEGRVVLVDFGLVRDASRTAATATGRLVGTPAYMAPEVLAGKPAGPASDWYGWGVCLYRFLEGRLPYEVDGIHAMIRGEDPGEPPFKDPGSEAARYAAAALLPDPGERIAAVTAVGMASKAKIRLRPTDGVVAPRLDEEEPGKATAPASPSAKTTAAMPPMRETPLWPRALAVFAISLLVGWLALAPAGPEWGAEAGGPAAQAERPELAELREAVERLTDPHRNDQGTFSTGTRGGTPDDHMIELRTECADGRIIGRIRRVLEKAAAYLAVTPPEEAAEQLDPDLTLGLLHMGVDEDMVASDVFSPHILGRPTGKEAELSRVQDSPTWAGTRDVNLLKDRLAEVKALKAEYADLGSGVRGLGGARLRAWVTNLQPGSRRERVAKEFLEEGAQSSPELGLQFADLASLIGSHGLDVGDDALACEAIRFELEGLAAAMERSTGGAQVGRARVASLIVVDGLDYLMRCVPDSDPEMVDLIYRGLEQLEREAARPGGVAELAGDTLWPLQCSALFPSLGARLLMSDRERLDEVFQRSRVLADRMRAHVGAAPLEAYKLSNSTLDALLGDDGP
jgi:serine/threonine-protein kinase